MVMCRGAISVVLCASVLACGEADSRWAGTMLDSAGVTIVSNTDVAVWTTGEEWTLEEDLRIGAPEGDPDYLFGAIVGIAVDSRERIFVLDGQAQHVQVYSPEGMYEQTVGSPGEGPGEIQRAAALLMGPGDTLLVPDPGNMRFNRYATDGTSAGGLRIDALAGVPIAFRTTPSGLLAERIRLRVEGVPTREDAIVLLGTDGSVADTLWTFPSAEFPNRASYQIYAPRQSWDIMGDTVLLMGDSEQYRIGLYSGRQLDRIIVKPFEQRMVSVRDKGTVNNALRTRYLSEGASSEMIERVLQRFDYSGPFPAFEAFVAGPNNTIWVQHQRAVSELSDEELATFDPRRDFAAPEWDIFDSAGRFLGVVTLPERFEPAVFRAEKVYGVWYDEQDLSYVVRLRGVGDLGERRVP